MGLDMLGGFVWCVYHRIQSFVFLTGINVHAFGHNF